MEKKLITMIREHPASISEIALATGLTRTTLHQFLLGKMSHKTKLKIVKFLGYEIKEILV